MARRKTRRKTRRHTRKGTRCWTVKHHRRCSRRHGTITAFGKRVKY